MNAQEIADWLVDQGLSVIVERIGGVKTFRTTDGFYKSDGCAFIRDVGDETVIVSRYDRSRVVSDPLDVILESKYWHDVSKERLEYWREPAATWERLYADHLD